MSTPIERLRELHKPCVMPCFDHAWVGDRQHCAGPHCLATWPCDTIAALDAHDALEAENARARILVDEYRDECVSQTFEIARLRERAMTMCYAYAGEMAARASGVEIKGFPLLDAYQRLFVELWPSDEPEAIQ